MSRHIYQGEQQKNREQLRFNRSILIFNFVRRFKYKIIQIL